MGSTQVMRMCGRGGTDLRLPFTWTEKAMQRNERISALVVCTDGFGPLPADAPDGLPVLFMLTPHHAAPSFGRHLVLPERL
jgi:predicted metal-dependent peptidase